MEDCYLGDGVTVESIRQATCKEIAGWILDLCGDPNHKLYSYDRRLYCPECVSKAVDFLACGEMPREE